MFRKYKVPKEIFSIGAAGAVLCCEDIVPYFRVSSVILWAETLNTLRQNKVLSNSSLSI